MCFHIWDEKQSTTRILTLRNYSVPYSWHWKFSQLSGPRHYAWIIFLSIMGRFWDDKQYELFFLSGENYMDVKMLGHWKKMNSGLSGHFTLTSFSIKLLTEVAKSNARTEFLAETHFHMDGCGPFLILSCLHVSFNQGSAKELCYRSPCSCSRLLSIPSSVGPWVVEGTLSLSPLYLQPFPGCPAQQRCLTSGCRLIEPGSPEQQQPQVI